MSPAGGDVIESVVKIEMHACRMGAVMQLYGDLRGYMATPCSIHEAWRLHGLPAPIIYYRLKGGKTLKDTGRHTKRQLL